MEGHRGILNELEIFKGWKKYFVVGNFSLFDPFFPTDVMLYFGIRLRDRLIHIIPSKGSDGMARADIGKDW
jgi:hypothetical protein